MKVVIFAGGRGTRFGTLTKNTPKPLILINGVPIVRRIMNQYIKFGYEEFILLTGYLSEEFRILFSNDRNVEVIDTGLETMTGGRLKKISNLLKGDFFLTYGDGLANVNINKLYEEHRSSSKILTITAVHPPSRFGLLNFEGDKFTGMSEKNILPVWVNGGFFVCTTEIFKFIKDDSDIFEVEVIKRLQSESQINIYKHSKFWHAIDDKRDKEIVENLLKRRDFDWL